MINIIVLVLAFGLVYCYGRYENIRETTNMIILKLIEISKTAIMKLVEFIKSKINKD